MGIKILSFRLNERLLSCHLTNAMPDGKEKCVKAAFFFIGRIELYYSARREMGNIVAKLHDLYYCPLDGSTFEVTGDHTVVKVTDPEKIEAGKNVSATNWRDFHLDGEKNPAGDSSGVYTGGAHNAAAVAPPDVPPNGNIDSWIEEAAKILAANGIILSEDEKRWVKFIAYHESGYDPHLLNDYDQNWKDGHPSKGLMQTIDDTFNHYRVPGYDDIWNPVHNIVAAVRYIKATYHSFENVPGVKAHLNGSDRYEGY
jgi:hypothetical protein